MRTDRIRLDERTSYLLAQEEMLRQADESGELRNAVRSLRGILTRIESLRHVRTSRELDHFLQLSMLYLASRLHFDFRPSPNARFAVSTSIYNPKHGLFVIKPSYCFPGACSVHHPTILLPPPRQGATPTDDSELVGLSGLALASGEVLHCTRLQGAEPCPNYVRLETTSASALSIPLIGDSGVALERFRHAKVESSGLTKHCCSCQDSLQRYRDPGRPGRRPLYGVLNIDCSTAELQLRLARRILNSKRIQGVLGAMSDRLARYREDRLPYRVLRTCTVLFQLSQHTLGARQAYVALLREISEICNGADVTLHLRDMFGASDKGRSVKLVAGVGSRFRGFLIGERYGGGLVGQAMAGEGQFVDLDAEEIRQAMNSKHPSGYRRLMPGTALNAALPIRFHRRVIGAINVEWPESLVKEKVLPSVDGYLETRKPALERLAKYLSLVIDYFDDRENLALTPLPEIVNSRRRVLAYYVRSAMRGIDAPPRSAAEEPHYLRDIIDAIGYFLTFEGKHRILASVRSKQGDYLTLEYAHGFDEKGDKGAGPGGPIRIAVGESVLGTCAELGIPIYGTVEDARTLIPDALCKECAPEEDKPRLGDTIQYRPAGHRPVYEVGVPLVFGGDILGTFDFELFSLAQGRAEKPALEQGEEAPIAIAGHQLSPFLEWVRAITFCMAYREDAHPESVPGKLDEPQRAAFRRAQRLCAQIIANVALPKEILTPIAGEYFRGLIPISEPQLNPSPNGGAQDEIRPPDCPPPPLAGEEPKEKTTDLWWRGQHLGTVRIALDEEDIPPDSAFPERSLATGTSALAQKLIAAFYAAALAADDPTEFDSSEFRVALNSVQSAFRDRVDNLRKQPEEFASLNPYRLIERYFDLLHQALHEQLLPSNGSGTVTRKPNEHGWFLYTARCVSGPDAGEKGILRCGSPAQRWASMSTQEMHSLCTRVLNSQDPYETLSSILKPVLGEPALQDWWKQARNGHAAGAEALRISLEDLFLEALASRDREYPDPDREQAPSLTTSTARLRRTLSVIDLNRSPFRSERRRQWFFGDEPYSIISVPILLGDRATCIGVLQVFRRREAIDDIRFFKNEEIAAVRQLGEAIQSAIAEDVVCLEAPALRGEEIGRSFSANVQELGARLQARIASGHSPVLVTCDFADDPGYSERFIETYVDRPHEVYTVSRLLRNELDQIEMNGRPVLCVLFNGENLAADPNTRPALKARFEALLTHKEHKRLVIVFASKSDVLVAADLLPSATPFDEQMEIDEPNEKLRVAFGLAEGRQTSDRDVIWILFRQQGEWSPSRLAEHHGGMIGALRKRISVGLGRLKNRKLIENRLLPSWYTCWDV